MSEKIKFAGKILNATVSKQANNWFISFTIEALISFLPCKSQASVGVDVGSKALATFSNGVQIFAPKPLLTTIRKLKKLSRQLSKKQHSRRKGDTTPKSNNFIKHSLKVAKYHAKVTNIRKDALHKLTTFLTNNFQYIAIEDLNIKGMMANGKLARTISDLGLFELRRQLEYKSKQKGNILVFANRWFPSSKTCHNCGNIKHDLKLSDRVYKCDNCGIEIDRDLNAAINLEKLNNVSHIPPVQREFTPVEMMAMLNRHTSTSVTVSLSNCSVTVVTSIVEAGSKQQIYSAMGRFA